MQAVSQAAATYKSNNDAGQLADYMSQYEQNPDQSGQLSAMSPDARLKAAMWTSQQNALDRKGDSEVLRDQLVRNQIRATDPNAPESAQDRLARIRGTQIENAGPGDETDEQRKERNMMLRENALAAGGGTSAKDMPTVMKPVDDFIARSATGVHKYDATLDTPPAQYDAVQAYRNNLNRTPQQRDLATAGGLYSPPPTAPAAPATPGANQSDAVMQQARDAIAQGAPVDAVVKRLQSMGIQANPSQF